MPPPDPEAGSRNLPAPQRRPHAPSRGWRHWIVAGAGWLFVLLGLAGMVLPFLQGFLFLFAGLWLLSLELAWAERLRHWVARRAPDRWQPHMDRAEAFSRRLLKRLLRE